MRLLNACVFHYVVFTEFVSEALHMISSHDPGNDQTSAFADKCNCRYCSNAFRMLALVAVLSFLHSDELSIHLFIYMFHGLVVQELKPKTKIGISGQFDATNPNTKPKVGFAFDLKN